MGEPLHVYTCTAHDGHYLSGVSVVIAHDEQEARALLDAALIDQGLYGSGAHPYDLQRVPLEPGAHVLFNGDY